MTIQPRTPAPDKINVPDIITLTARLAQLLAEEVDLLGSMNIKQIKELQQEKLFITNALDAHRKVIAKHPHLKETIPSQDKADLEGVVRVFEDILEENHRRLQMAKEVNGMVVNAVTQVVRDAAMSNVYDGQGTKGALGADALSVTLNQMV